MRLLAIDYGTKKCGIAISDPLKIISQPLTTIFYNKGDYIFLINEIEKIVNEYQPIEKFILGLPKNIDNSLSPTGKLVKSFSKMLSNHFKEIEIIFVDEKYSTQNSINIMKEMKLSKEQKKNKKDSIAAQIILENYMKLH